MNNEIEKLHDELVSQLEAPAYKFKMRMRDGSIQFHIDTKINKDNISVTDPITEILLDKCVDIEVNKYLRKCMILPYTSRDKSTVMEHVERYLLSFLEDHLKQKNPKVTKLYKWMSYYLQSHNAPRGFSGEQLMLFRYLKANDNASDPVHVKNGIGILNALKIKYEKLGHELEAGSGRRRRNRY